MHHRCTSAVRSARAVAGVALAAGLAWAAPAALAGPAGTAESPDNQVDCTPRGGDQGVWFGTGTVELHAGTSGAYACHSGRAPFQGRVMADTEGWVAVDGDADNPAPLDGFVRVGTDGATCGGPQGQDASSDQRGSCL